MFVIEDKLGILFSGNEADMKAKFKDIQDGKVALRRPNDTIRLIEIIGSF